MSRIKGWCKLCEKSIVKGQITKKVKALAEHEDFQIVHKRCVLAVSQPHANKGLLNVYNSSSPRNLDTLVRNGFMHAKERRETLKRWGVTK
jgi:hypothetical protein